jgi:cytidylate kinase
MIVTIDGPAGAGKSTVARRLADRLGFRFLDTGATYRSVALAGLRAGVDWSEPSELLEVAERITMELVDGVVLLDGEDVSDTIRTPEVTAVTRYAADNRAIRERLVQWQRDFGSQGDTVTEGRDQGTVVFPDAELKLFLTATPEERARRRVEQLRESGVEVDYESILQQQIARDAQDEGRDFGGLRTADDAVTVWTDGLTTEAVLDQLIALVRERQTTLA